MKRRVTTKRGRKNKNGIYNPNHNDRNYPIEKDEHVDSTKTSQNLTYTWCQKKFPGYTFEEAEKHFYEKYFSESVEARNNRYIKSGHKERCKTIDEYRTSDRTCPEEAIYYIGKKGQDISATQLWNCVALLIKKLKEKYPNVRILNVALHQDESGQLHVHVRSVFMAKDRFGLWVANENQCLKDAGVDLPCPTKKEGKYNNRKITYTSEVRQNFIDIAKSQGFDIEIEPDKKTSKRQLELIEYQCQEEQKKLEMLQTINQELEDKLLFTVGNNPYFELQSLKEFLEKKYPKILDEFNQKIKDAMEKMKKILNSKKSTGIKEKNAFDDLSK